MKDFVTVSVIVISKFLEFNKKYTHLQTFTDGLLYIVESYGVERVCRLWMHPVLPACAPTTSVSTSFANKMSGE